MTIGELAEKLGCTLLAGGKGAHREVDGCYIGDFHSWVMARAQMDNVWLTVMGNINTIAVAKLTDVAGVFLCEGSALQEDAANRAELEGIPVFACGKNLYDTAIGVYEALK